MQIRTHKAISTEAVQRQCLINAVVSMGRRNTFLKFTRRSLKT